MHRQLVALVAVATLLFLGAGAIAMQYEGSVLGANDVQTFNESFTVDEGNLQTFAESNRDVVYNDTVRVVQSGTVIEQDGNYTWHAINGTLLVQVGSDLTDGASATNEYQLTEPNQSQQLVRDVGLLPSQLAEALLVALAAAVVIGGIWLITRGNR